MIPLCWANYPAIRCQSAEEAINSLTEIICLISIIHPDSHTQTRRLNCMRAAEMLQRHCSGCEMCCSAGKRTPPTPHRNVPGRILHSENTSNRTANPCWEFRNEDVHSEFLSHSWQDSAVKFISGQQCSWSLLLAPDVSRH